MKNKGFTLVELMAVITILAIIAIITVPTVLGVLKPVNEKAGEVNGKMMENAASKWVTSNGIPTGYVKVSGLCNCFISKETLVSENYLSVKKNNKNTNSNLPDGSGVLITFTCPDSLDDANYKYVYDKTNSTGAPECNSNDVR